MEPIPNKISTIHDHLRLIQSVLIDIIQDAKINSGIIIHIIPTKTCFLDKLTNETLWDLSKAGPSITLK
jgi:hypothetical protein